MVSFDIRYLKISLRLIYYNISKCIGTVSIYILRAIKLCQVRHVTYVTGLEKLNNIDQLNNHKMKELFLLSMSFRVRSSTNKLLKSQLNQ